MTNVSKFYYEVMDDVLKEVKSDLEYEGLDTQFLDQLKTLWEEKLKDTNVTTGDRHPVSAVDYHMLQLQNRQNQSYTVNRANLQTQKPIAPTNPAMININRTALPRQQIINSQTVSNQSINRPILITQPSAIPISNQQTGNTNTVLSLQTNHAQQGQQQANFGQNQIANIGGQNLQVLQINNLPYIIPSNVIMTRPTRPHIQQPTLHMQQPQLQHSLSNVQHLNQAQLIQSSFQPAQNQQQNRIPKSQVDGGKDSDYDDDEFDNVHSIKQPQTNQSMINDEIDDHVDIMSEAPSSVRGPMSNLPPPTPLHSVHGGSIYGSIGGLKSLKNPLSNVNTMDDSDDDLVSTSNTPRPGNAKKPKIIKMENDPNSFSGNRHSDSEFEDDLPGYDFNDKRSRLDNSSLHDVSLDLSKKKIENSTELDDSNEVDEEGVPIRLPNSASGQPSSDSGRPKTKRKKCEPGEDKNSSADLMNNEDKLSDNIDIENDDDDDDDDEDDDDDDEPLNSQDDVSDEDADVIFEADNLIVCQYDKIHRSRNKWRLHFKDGIMSIKGRDYLFQKATGEAEW